MFLVCRARLAYNLLIGYKDTQILMYRQSILENMAMFFTFSDRLAVNNLMTEVRLYYIFPVIYACV